MAYWQNHFLQICFQLAALAALLPWLFRLGRNRMVVNGTMQFIVGLATMLVLSALASVLAHTSEFDVISALRKDPLGGLAYFSETGLETLVVWFPVFVLSLYFSLRLGREK